MKIAVRYHSRGGNTKAVAEAIAKEAGVSAETIDIPLEEAVDLLFIGGGIYAGSIDKRLKGYLERLDPALVGSIAPFVTNALMGGTDKISAAAKERGVGVSGASMILRMGTQNYGGKKGYATLSDRQKSVIAKFVQSAVNS